MSGHTKEPRYGYVREPRTPSDPLPHGMIANIPRVLSSVGRDLALTPDDLRRIIAYVNACAGIETERLESIAGRGHTLDGRALIYKLDINWDEA